MKLRKEPIYETQTNCHDSAPKPGPNGGNSITPRPLLRQRETAIMGAGEDPLITHEEDDSYLLALIQEE